MPETTHRRTDLGVAAESAAPVHVDGDQLVHLRAGRSGKSGRRFEQLAGTFEQRRELYWARKYLHFTVDEWKTLPWWQARLYIEQFNAEQDALAKPEKKSPLAEMG